MVLKDARLHPGTKSTGNIFSFLLGKDNASEILVHREVIIQGARVLGGNIHRLAVHGPRLAVKRVAMGSSLNIRTGLVNR
jgi:hypothetical protein